MKFDLTSGLYFINHVHKRKRKRSDSVLWQKPLHPQNNPKEQRDNIKTPTKTLITQLLRTDLGRSVGVTAVTQLVWLNQLRVLNLPTHRKSSVINRTWHGRNIV